MTGKVVRLNKGKAYGFIRPDAASKDYFFHIDDFGGDWNLLVNDFFEENKVIYVEFTEIKSPKGLRASDVTRTDLEE